MNSDFFNCRNVRLSIKTVQYNLGMTNIFDKMAFERILKEMKNSENSSEDGFEYEEVFDDDDEDGFGEFGGFEPDADSGDKVELVTEAEYRDDGKRIEIRYNETELTGMEGAVTCISFDKNAPGIISILRGGSVYTVMIFEEGKRHICAYETPFTPFELCIFTTKVKNCLESEPEGFLELDYLIEIRGAGTERTVFHMDVFPIAGQVITESDEVIAYTSDTAF